MPNKFTKQTWRSTSSSSLRLCQTLELDHFTSCGQKFYLLRGCACTSYSSPALVQWNSCHTIWRALLIFCATIWISPRASNRYFCTASYLPRWLRLFSLICCHQRVDREWLLTESREMYCTAFLGASSRTLSSLLAFSFCSTEFCDELS